MKVVGPDPGERDATPQVVVVRWQDAWYDADQGSPGEWRHEYPILTVGFLVRDEPDLISIAQELLPQGDGFRSVTHIPRSCVESIRNLDDLPEIVRPTG